jgi:hypothetical protein
MNFINNLAPQTKLAAIGMTVLLLSMIIGAIQKIGKAPVFTYILPIILFLITSCLSLYGLNCTVVGSCNIWAWIVSCAICIASVYGILLYTRNAFKK